MNFPVFSQLAGNFGFPETGSLETASSSRESTNFRFLSIPPAADRGGSVLPLPMSVEGSGSAIRLHRRRCLIRLGGD